MDQQPIDDKIFKDAFYSAPIGMALVTPEGKWFLVNQKLSQLLEYTPVEMQSLTFQQITHPDDLDKDLTLVNQMLSKEISNYTLEKGYIKKSGQAIWISLSVTLIWEDTKPKYFIAQIIDMSKLKEAESKLQTKIEELEKFNKAMIDRELKMVELKQELADLKNSLGPNQNPQ